MADKSDIAWTEATWNVFTGCSVKSPACTNCYAMKLAGTRLKHHPSRVGLTQNTSAGPVWTGEVRFNEEWLTQPLQWKRPRKIFVCAHSDLFHESVPDEWIDRVFAVMALAPQHIFQVLTKRPERMLEYLSRPAVEVRIGLQAFDLCLQAKHSSGGKSKLGSGLSMKASDINPGGLANWPLPYVWIGCTVENQKTADERIPLLLQTPAAIRWISCEPLLGKVDLSSVVMPDGDSLGKSLYNDGEGCGIDWVVCGGESGQEARPMHPDWARLLRDQCQQAGVAFFFKQWGAFTDEVPYKAGPCVLKDDVDDVQRHNRVTAWPNGKLGSGSAETCGGMGISLHRVGTQKAPLLDEVLHEEFPLLQ